MLKLFVKAQMAAHRAHKWMKERQEGMSMIEYGVLGAFLVLFLVGAATFVGPRFKTWIIQTSDSIIGGSGK